MFYPSYGYLVIPFIQPEIEELILIIFIYAGALHSKLTSLSQTTDVGT